MNMATSLQLAMLATICFNSDAQSTRNVRVEFEVRRLTNTRGIARTGAKCDLMSPCDTRLTGYVDTSPLPKGWPGTRRLEDWPKLFEKSNEDNPVINKVVSADLCSGNFRKAVLRLHAVDVDPGVTNDFIDDFECLSGSNIASSEAVARWSDEETCETKYNPTNTKVAYRYRVYAVPPGSCGKPPSRPTKP